MGSDSIEIGLKMSHLADAVNRAAVYADPGTTKISLVELPIPQPGAGEILVRM
jgi:hypothetical protein